jgi:hypothetical protein
MPNVSLPAPYNRGQFGAAGLVFQDGLYSGTAALTPRQLQILTLLGATIDATGTVYSVPRSQTPASQADIDTLAAAAVLDWAPTTVYAAGTLVLNPAGTIVKAASAHTSGASYDATKWAAAGADSGGWATPTLSTGWSAAGGVFAAPSYRRDALGYVHLRGTLASAAGLTGTIYTLPAGFRPAAAQRFPAASALLHGAVQVGSDGVVSAQANPGATLALDSVSFLAEQ